MYIEPGRENACRLEWVWALSGPTLGGLWCAGDSLQIHTNERDEDPVWIVVSILLEQSIERLQVVKVLRDAEFVFIFTVQKKISARWTSGREGQDLLLQRWAGKVECPAKDEGNDDEESTHLQAANGNCASG